MKNRVAVTIAGQEYTLVAAEDESYVHKTADYVDQQVQALMRESRLSLMDAAVLTAMNIADEYYKEVENGENLRRQLKEALEEAARLKLELSEAKREIFKLESKR